MLSAAGSAGQGTNAVAGRLLAGERVGRSSREQVGNVRVTNRAASSTRGPACPPGVHYLTWSAEGSRHRRPNDFSAVTGTTVRGVDPVPSRPRSRSAESGAGTAFPETQRLAI